MKVEIIEIETPKGTRRISMRSTGQGAWVAVDRAVANPVITCKIRPMGWISQASEIDNLLQGECTP